MVSIRATHTHMYARCGVSSQTQHSNENCHICVQRSGSRYAHGIKRDESIELVEHSLWRLCRSSSLFETVCISHMHRHEHVLYNKIRSFRTAAPFPTGASKDQQVFANDYVGHTHIIANYCRSCLLISC